MRKIPAVRRAWRAWSTADSWLQMEAVFITITILAFVVRL